MNYIKRFPEHRIGVVGDLMADHYIIGEVDRISPEAPAPVLLIAQEKLVPGGVGNTAANIAALGAKVDVVGVIGKDEAGKNLIKQLKSAGINTAGVIESSDRPTVQKTRVIARSQQIVRLDREKNSYLDSRTEKKAIEFVSNNIRNWQALIVSDYAKGMITENLAKAVVKLATRYKKPLVVDAKPKHFRHFRGATIFTPNRKEAETIFGSELKNEKDIRLAGRELQQKFRSSILVTRGAEGVTLFQGNKVRHFPSRAREVFDVTGAGDTLAAVLALALASGASLRQASEMANAAAGIVVGKVGTATVSLKELTNFYS